MKHKPIRWGSLLERLQLDYVFDTIFAVGWKNIPRAVVSIVNLARESALYLERKMKFDVAKSHLAHFTTQGLLLKVFRSTCSSFCHIGNSETCIVEF